MPSYLFRRLQEKELDAGYGIIVEVTDWLLSQGVRQWLQPLPYETYVTRQRSSENYGLFMDNELAAVVSLMNARPDYWASSLPKTDFKWMATLASARKFKGHKLGELALSEAEHFLAVEGVPAIYLDCIYGNGALPKFYELLGYHQIVRKPIEFPHGTLDSVLMRKRL